MPRINAPRIIPILIKPDIEAELTQMIEQQNGSILLHGP